MANNFCRIISFTPFVELGSYYFNKFQNSLALSKDNLKAQLVTIQLWEQLYLSKCNYIQYPIFNFNLTFFDYIQLVIDMIQEAKHLLSNLVTLKDGLFRKNLVRI
jgi:hypothetical protein